MILDPDKPKVGETFVMDEEKSGWWPKSRAWKYNAITGWWMLTFLIFTLLYYVAVKFPYLNIPQEERFIHTAIFFSIAGAISASCFLNRKLLASAWLIILGSILAIWIVPTAFKGESVAGLTWTAFASISGSAFVVIIVAVLCMWRYLLLTLEGISNELVVPFSRSLSISITVVLSADFIFHDIEDWLSSESTRYSYLFLVVACVMLARVVYEYIILPNLKPFFQSCCSTMKKKVLEPPAKKLPELPPKKKVESKKSDPIANKGLTRILAAFKDKFKSKPKTGGKRDNFLRHGEYQEVDQDEVTEEEEEEDEGGDYADLDLEAHGHPMEEEDEVEETSTKKAHKKKNKKKKTKKKEWYMTYCDHCKQYGHVNCTKGC